jgi:hypothetical protein
LLTGGTLLCFYVLEYFLHQILIRLNDERRAEAEELDWTGGDVSIYLYDSQGI